MRKTSENMDFHENTDSVNDTEVIEALFTPYTGEPMAQQNVTVKILIDLLQRLLLREKMV